MDGFQVARHIVDVYVPYTDQQRAYDWIKSMEAEVGKGQYQQYLEATVERVERELKEYVEQTGQGFGEPPEEYDA